MSNFEIGDLVLVFSNDNNIISDDSCKQFINGISQIEEITSEGLARLVMDGRSMMAPIESLRKLTRIKLTFAPNDNETWAMGYFGNRNRLIYSVARCHPDEKYDAYKGADVALRRLFGKEENTDNVKIKKNDMLVVTGKRAPFDVGTVVKALEDERDYTDYVKCFGYSSNYNCLKSYFVEKKYLTKVVEE